MSQSSNFYRKFAVPVLASALLVSTVGTASAASYTDVSDRYMNAVNYLEVNQITKGLTATSFGTGKAIKRADAAILLAKAMKLDVTNVPASSFTDVPDRAVKYVDALKAKGIVNGKTSGSFASNQFITRGEAAMMLASAYGLNAGATVNKFTDVSPKYAAAVNSLLNSKVTSGKTATSFGLTQALTRGEFAIFLHKLSAVALPGAQVSVANATELSAALSNNNVTAVKLTNNITATALPVIKRNVKIDLNGKVLTGNLEYQDYVGTEEIQLLSSIAGGKLNGDLTIDAPKSDFNIGENVTVTGNTTIINVKENTFYNNGSLNTVDVKDNDGFSFVNNGPGVVTTLSINTTGNVTLTGKLDSVEVNQAANITVTASSDITNLDVKVENVILTAPTNTVKTMKTSPGVDVKDATGTTVVIAPPSGGGTTPPPVQPPTVDVKALMDAYEVDQKAFIASNYSDNVVLYEKGFELYTKRETLGTELATATLTDAELARLTSLNKTLADYLVVRLADQIKAIAPTVGANEIELATNLGLGVKINWSSSHPNIISTDGVITRPSTATEVTLTANVSLDSVSKTFTYKVIVQP